MNKSSELLQSASSETLTRLAEALEPCNEAAILEAATLATPEERADLARAMRLTVSERQEAGNAALLAMRRLANLLQAIAEEVDAIEASSERLDVISVLVSAAADLLDYARERQEPQR